MTGSAKVGAVVAIASASSIAAVFVPAAPWTADLFGWLREAGTFGVLVYAVVFAAAAICLVPGSILTVGAGVAYGLVWGTVVASAASAIAATAAFLVARTLARRRVARWVSTDARVAALDAAIGAHGLRLVILVRLSPLIPFNILNYALGLTRVRLRDYVLGSFLGMLPVTVLYVYVGSLAGQLASLARGTADGGPLRHAVSAAGLAATIAATIYVTRLARRALDDALGSRDPGGTVRDVGSGSARRRGSRPASCRRIRRRRAPDCRW